MSDASPDNSTFAQRARARGAKQVTGGQALNKGLVPAGVKDERLNDPEAEKDSEPAPSPPAKTRAHK